MNNVKKTRVKVKQPERGYAQQNPYPGYQRHLSNELFKALIKLGAQWQGDIISTRWSEYLFLGSPSVDMSRVEDLLDCYLKDVDYAFSNAEKTGIYL